MRGTDSFPAQCAFRQKRCFTSDVGSGLAQGNDATFEGQSTGSGNSPIPPMLGEMPNIKVALFFVCTFSVALIVQAAITKELSTCATELETKVAPLHWRKRPNFVMSLDGKAGLLLRGSQLPGAGEYFKDKFIYIHNDRVMVGALSEEDIRKNESKKPSQPYISLRVDMKAQGTKPAHQLVRDYIIMREGLDQTPLNITDAQDAGKDPDAEKDRFLQAGAPGLEERSESVQLFTDMTKRKVERTPGRVQQLKVLGAAAADFIQQGAKTLLTVPKTYSETTIVRFEEITDKNELTAQLALALRPHCSKFGGAENLDHSISSD